MLKVVKMVGQIVLLWVIYWLGNKIMSMTGIAIPGNVIGMGLLFVLLSCGILKLEYIEEGAGFLLKHLLFFFVPYAVGLMNWGSVFYNYGVVLFVAIVLGAIIPYFIVGHVVQFFHREDKQC
ncbi:MAG: cidA 2 [Firmicutes bacterium]|nr:cidA 2 [Bacillota bacterium]